MIDVKADSKGCLIREMTGSEIEILADIIELLQRFWICYFNKRIPVKRTKKWQ